MADGWISGNEVNLVEPGALGGFASQSLHAKREVNSLLSIAISLKRIADALAGNPPSSGMRHTLEDIADRMGR
jgi:hypothetical protein